MKCCPLATGSYACLCVCLRLVSAAGAGVTGTNQAEGPLAPTSGLTRICEDCVIACAGQGLFAHNVVALWGRACARNHNEDTKQKRSDMSALAQKESNMLLPALGNLKRVSRYHHWPQFTPTSLICSSLRSSSLACPSAMADSSIAARTT